MIFRYAILIKIADIFMYVSLILLIELARYIVFETITLSLFSFHFGIEEDLSDNHRHFLKFKMKDKL